MWIYKQTAEYSKTLIYVFNKCITKKFAIQRTTEVSV
jgi:hypothetical protein